jgi:quinol monooxygenase YgiN
MRLPPTLPEPPVHAVLFQFRPHPDQRDTYFALVAKLRPELQRIDGFLENERFASTADPSHGV